MTKQLQQLHPIFHSLDGLIFWANPKGRILEYNPAAQGVFESQNQLPNTIFEIIPTLSLLRWQEIIRQVESKRFFKSEKRVLLANGNILEVNIAMAPYESDTYIVVLTPKLSNLANPQANSSQPLLELISFTLDHSNNLIFWVREDASIFYANARVSDFLGYSPKELESLKFIDLNPDLTMDRYQIYWQQLQEDGDMEVEHLFYKKDGSSFFVEASLFFVDFKEQNYCCIFMRNITLRKEKETQLNAALEKIKTLKTKLEEEKSYLKAEVSENYSFNNIISKSPNYRQVLNQVAQVADTDSTVLILGETGTGKELLARAIHGLSHREEKPLIKVNCASLPSQLIESELFGHEKGAFTGAIARKPGKFEIADGGTLFLDEIGELPLELQAKLLRALQEGEIERVGNPHPIKVNVRIIAATNRDLEEMVHHKKFREDLYYRLNVFPIYNIPLRERSDDIPLLVQFFLEKYCRKTGKKIDKIPQGAVKKLMDYDFPGNIRELENLIERSVIISTGTTLQLESVIPQKKKTRNKKGFLTLEELQKKHIIKALRKTKGKVTGANSASELLGVKGKTLASRMTKLGIDRFDFLE